MNKKRLTEEQRKEYETTMGYRLDQAMKSKNITNIDLAEKLGISDQMVSDYKNKENALLRAPFERIIRICEILEIDTYYLLGLITPSTKEINEICTYTGLSEDAVRLLHEDIDYYFFVDKASLISALDYMLTQTNIRALADLFNCIKKYCFFSSISNASNTPNECNHDLYSLLALKCWDNLLSCIRKLPEDFGSVEKEYFTNSDKVPYIHDSIENDISNTLSLFDSKKKYSSEEIAMILNEIRIPWA